MKEVHISNVSNTEIVVKEGAVTGAMHVTKCNGVKLSCQSFHQLRIHESSDLRFTIGDAKSSGGVILEDCRNLTFIINCLTSGHSGAASDGVVSDETQLLDVRDFNWLRNGIPSPNFEIETVLSDREFGKYASFMPSTLALVDPTLLQDAKDEPEVAAAATADVEAEESDEDEL